MRALAVIGVVAGIFVLLLGGIAYSAYRYEEARMNRILPGVSVAGVEVGGMTRAQAIQAVRGSAAVRLNDPITVTVANEEWTVTPQQLGERAGVVAAVNRALALNDTMGTFTRFWHRFRQQPVDREIPLRFGGDRGVDGFVRKVADAVARDPVDARLTTDGVELVQVHPRDGRALDTRSAARTLRRALVRREDAVSLRTSPVKPDVGVSDLGATVVVRVDENRLYLYDGFEITHSWPVATAKPPWVTPAGDWIVERKAENPTWYNPAPDGWASASPLVVPGGPENPMGIRALYIDAPGLIRIHGTSTPERPSIGHYESHGCIRMLNEDVVQLYPLVPVGSHVLIIGERPY
jgi:lipoprotein-anchoring transpeptidase ErfK/SrfK